MPFEIFKKSIVTNFFYKQLKLKNSFLTLLLLQMYENIYIINCSRRIIEISFSGNRTTLGKPGSQYFKLN